MKRFFQHYVYEKEELNKCDHSHLPAKTMTDKLAFLAIKAIRSSFDFITGFKKDSVTEKQMITRIIYLETVAG